MLSAVLYSYRLRRLQAAKRKIRNVYKKRYQEAKQEKQAAEDLAMIVQEEIFETDLVDEEIWIL